MQAGSLQPLVVGFVEIQEIIWQEVGKDISRERCVALCVWQHCLHGMSAEKRDGE